jgi:hypothetical protein
MSPMMQNNMMNMPQQQSGVHNQFMNQQVRSEDSSDFNR